MTQDQRARIQAALGDRYRLDRELGEGGMATVYLAHDERHRREVAVKVLHPAVATSIGPDRFLREIEIAAGLRHPSILGLLDSGEADGVLYYVMPLVEGPTLRRRLIEQRELPIDDAVAILRDLVGALSYAHARGIIHRDVKPENVLLTGSRAQLADFGIAKALHDASRNQPLTATGMAIGTPAYMSPEQASGDSAIDPRADLYAVGVVAYEMLTGAPPFSGATAQHVMAAHFTRTPEPLDAIRPTVPRGLAATIMRCLEKRPADRWQSADDLLRRLAPESISGETVRIRPTIAHGSMKITEDICRRVDRASFDPRMLGDRMSYLDNQLGSDVLVILLNRWGLDADGMDSHLLESIPHRTVVPTLFGFDAGRRVRFPLTVEDHVVFLDALVRDLAAKIQPRYLIVAGFSAGGDLVLRLAAANFPVSPIDGCLSVGSNLGIETCFITRLMAEIGSADPAVLLPALNHAIAGATTIPDWVNIGSYLIRIVANFETDWTPVQTFSRSMIAPWERDGLEPFIEWVRTITAAGTTLRCVFEDGDVYRRQVRTLQVRNLDQAVFGPAYRPGSIVIEPVAGHFELMEPDRLNRHLDALISEIRAG